jgi:hypothetical protein
MKILENIRCKLPRMDVDHVTLRTNIVTFSFPLIIPFF